MFARLYMPRGLGQAEGQDASLPVAPPMATDPFSNLLASFQGLTAGWGVWEYVILIVGSYLLISVVFTTKTAASKVSSGIGSVRSKRRRARKLREESADLPWWAKL
jgi:hypothetical protein